MSSQKTVPYYQGRIDGRLREWREDGTIKTIAYFKYGKQNGEAKTWYKNGILATSSYYNENGELSVQK